MTYHRIDKETGQIEDVSRETVVEMVKETFSGDPEVIMLHMEEDGDWIQTAFSYYMRKKTPGKTIKTSAS